MCHSYVFVFIYCPFCKVNQHPDEQINLIQFSCIIPFMRIDSKAEWKVVWILISWLLKSFKSVCNKNVLYKNQRNLEETGKRGQETYNISSLLCSYVCSLFTRFSECTDIKVCLITSFLVKPSSWTLLVQTPQLTFVSRNRISLQNIR